MKIYPYKQGSVSARALADALKIKILKHAGKKLNKPDVVINWGSSNPTRQFSYNGFLNHPEDVAKAANKLVTLSYFREHGVACPEWSEDADDAVKWLAEGFDVVSRCKLNGHSGEGIVINKALSGIYEVATLYTKYIKKDQEYRIHVAGGEIIFQQRKARKREVPDEEVNWQVRNLAGGFIFANDGIVAPDNVMEVASAAVAALGLDFGAVDIITNKKGEAFALEVNTAPGLSGKTLQAYVRFFSQFQ